VAPWWGLQCHAGVTMWSSGARPPVPTLRPVTQPGPFMATPTEVLSTVPASFRVKRNQAGGAEQQLRFIDSRSDDFTIRQLAYGVLYADSTGRTTGSVSIALRRATPWQAAQLLAAMRNAGVDVIAEVSRWMNSNAMSVLG
jgi:hypothetical protein